MKFSITLCFSTFREAIIIAATGVHDRPPVLRIQRAETLLNCNKKVASLRLLFEKIAVPLHQIFTK